MADNNRLTIKTARGELADIGYSLRHVDGEFRVAPKAGDEAQREARAYYTTDLADAVGTAKAERSRGVFIEGALTATLDRVLCHANGPEGSGRADSLSQYPGERLVSRFAGITRNTDNDKER